MVGSKTTCEGDMQMLMHWYACPGWTRKTQCQWVPVGEGGLTEADYADVQTLLFTHPETDMLDVVARAPSNIICVVSDGRSTNRKFRVIRREGTNLIVEPSSVAIRQTGKKTKSVYKLDLQAMKLIDYSGQAQGVSEWSVYGYDVSESPQGSPEAATTIRLSRQGSAKRKAFST